MAETKEKLQAIFFDFDGVILDSTRTKTQGFVSLFKDYGSEIIDKVIRHHRKNGGISRVEKIKYAHETIIGKPLTPAEIDQWADRYSRLVVKKVTQCPWIKGAREFLDSCPKDLKIFVISGTPALELTHVIEQREMAHYFHEILGSPTKKPDHIRRLLKKHGLNPTCCVFVGDALTDFHAARETRLRFVGIQGEAAFPDGTRCLTDCRDLRTAVKEHFIL